MICNYASTSKFFLVYTADSIEALAEHQDAGGDAMSEGGDGPQPCDVNALAKLVGITRDQDESDSGTKMIHF